MKTRLPRFQLSEPSTFGVIAKRSSTSARSIGTLKSIEIEVAALTSVAVLVGGWLVAPAPIGWPLASLSAVAPESAAMTVLRTETSLAAAAAFAAARSGPARWTWKSVTAGAVTVVNENRCAERRLAPSAVADSEPTTTR